MGHKRCQLCQVVQKNGENWILSHENWLKVCEITAETDTKKMSVCFRCEIEEFTNYIRLKPGTILLEYLQFLKFFKSEKFLTIS